jgi:hypothetical protein
VAKVYVVTGGEYSSSFTWGVFSSRENAEAFAKEVQEDGQIEEFELDEHVDAKYLPGVAAIQVRLDTGDARTPPDILDHFWRSRLVLFPPSGFVVYNWENQTPPFILCVSAVSMDHAVKMATEYRQAWLRAKTEFQPPAPSP